MSQNALLATAPKNPVSSKKNALKTDVLSSLASGSIPPVENLQKNDHLRAKKALLRHFDTHLYHFATPSSFCLIESYRQKVSQKHKKTEMRACAHTNNIKGMKECDSSGGDHGGILSFLHQRKTRFHSFTSSDLIGSRCRRDARHRSFQRRRRWRH